MKMSRRDTILVAVLINAGLLLILFATAIDPKKNQKPVAAQTVVSAEKPVEKVEPSPKKEEPKLPESVVAVANPLEEISLIAAKPTKENKPFQSISIKRGDTLDKLAKQYETTVETLVELNELESSLLSIGQVIKVPSLPGFKLEPTAKKTVAENTPSTTRREYTVQSGDSPWLISRKNGVDLHELLEINNLDTESAKKLKPGMKLMLPSK